MSFPAVVRFSFVPGRFFGPSRCGFQSRRLLWRASVVRPCTFEETATKSRGDGGLLLRDIQAQSIQRSLSSLSKSIKEMNGPAEALHDFRPATAHFQTTMCEQVLVATTLERKHTTIILWFFRQRMHIRFSQTITHVKSPPPCSPGRRRPLPQVGQVGWQAVASSWLGRWYTWRRTRRRGASPRW